MPLPVVIKLLHFQFKRNGAIAHGWVYWWAAQGRESLWCDFATHSGNSV